ncbi:hypothetical protein [Arsenicicoccus dermatophilus]|uniref:hypothetical protein n=1 Tax=Arsenicicoccus dermatophilus TaxID=1076331 RepID=UPI001F4CA4EE|nr:hypothetical protein [Arsenicicoccus dermatophilus]MCH8612882.1 hypothetical protein [Arsenicicoccus dermatophilus]
MPRRSTLVAAAASSLLAMSVGLSGHATASSAAPTRTVAAVRQVPVSRATVSKIYWAIATDRSMRGWKRADWRVQRVQVVSGGWARATVHATKGQTDDAVVVLRMVNGRWTVADLGTAQVGCGIAPAAVLKALHLGGC